MAKPWYVVRRGELMTEQFLRQLEAVDILRLRRSTTGLDFGAFFSQSNGFLVAIGIRVEVTETQYRGQEVLTPAAVARIRHATLRILLVLVDVKRTEIHFGWLGEPGPLRLCNNLEISKLRVDALYRPLSEA